MMKWVILFVALSIIFDAAMMNFCGNHHLWEVWTALFDDIRISDK